MRYSVKLCVLVAALLSLPGAVRAQTAGMVSFQGLIRDAQGVPTSQPVTLEFRVYDQASGGSLVDMDGDGTVENVLGQDAKVSPPLTPNGGIVSTKFGPVSPKAFDGNPRWLEVTVQGSPTPLSRIEMATAPATAELMRVPATDPIVPPLASAVSVGTNGNVGIGTTTPSARLEVLDSLQLRDSDIAAINGYSGPLRITRHLASGQYINLNRFGANAWSIGTVYNSNTFAIGLGQPSDSAFVSPAFAIDTAGNVGIGTTNPGRRLDVVSGPGNESAIRFGNNFGFGELAAGSAGLVIRTQDSADRLTILHSNGNVGIGTTNPQARLHVGLGADWTQHGWKKSLALEDASALELGYGSSTKWGLGNSGGLLRLFKTTDEGTGEIPTYIVSVDPSGNFGICTTTPTANLHIRPNSGSAAAPASIRVDMTGTGDGSPNSIVVGADGPQFGGTAFVDTAKGGAAAVTPLAIRVNGTERMRVSTSGSVGIGTPTPGFLLEVNGPAGKPGGGSWSLSSDERLKKNISPLRNALDLLLRLRGVTFEYKDPAAIHELSGRRIGMIAQDVEKVVPDWVDDGPAGYKRVTYRGFEALTTEAIRELKNENDELKTRLAAMEKRLAALEAAASRRAKN